MILALLLAAMSGQVTPMQPMPRGTGLPPPVSEESQVLVPINAVFAAFEAGDAAAMLRHVDPDGRVTAVGPRPDGTSGVRRMSFTQFATRITPDKAFQERITNPAIEIDGDVAMVWAPFTVRIAGKVESCGYDLFDMVRENGSWRIANVTFSSRSTGCEAG